MDLLFSIAPFGSHLAPALPVIAEAVARGHRARVVTAPALAAAIAKAGAEPIALPAEALARPVRARRGLDSLRQEIIHNFIGPARAQAEALARAAAERGPDALVSDPGLTGALFVDAERARGRALPWVALGFLPLSLGRGAPPFGLCLRPGAGPLYRARDAAAELLLDRLLLRAVQVEADRVRAELGLPPLPRRAIDHVVEAPDAYLQGTVEELEYPRRALPASLRFVGPFLPAVRPDAAPPPWWRRVLDAPRVVFVTQGQVDNDPRKLLLPTLEALADREVLVVATTGGAAVDRARVPANAVVTPFVPYDAIMRHSQVVVTNAGYGGVQCALRHGVPLVVAGRTQEKGEICARVAWAGVGLDLRTDRPTPAALRRAIDRALADPRLGARARQIGARMRTTDAPRAAIDAVEDLVRARARASA